MSISMFLTASCIALCLPRLAVAGQWAWPWVPQANSTASDHGVLGLQNYNREFQVRMNASDFAPMMTQGWPHLVQYLLKQMPEECRRRGRCILEPETSMTGGTADIDMNATGLQSESVNLTSQATAIDYLEEFWKLDTSHPHLLLDNNMALILRNRFVQRRSYLALKFNSPDPDLTSSNDLQPQKTHKAKTKLELDIYPCRQKYAISIKISLPAYNTTQVSVVGDMKQYWPSVLQGSTSETWRRKMVPALKPTVRRILEVPMRIGFVKDQGGVAYAATVFTLSAAYASVADAEEGEKVPLRVEMSYRVEATQIAKGGVRLLQSAWAVYALLMEYASVIERDCTMAVNINYMTILAVVMLAVIYQYSMVKEEGDLGTKRQRRAPIDYGTSSPTSAAFNGNIGLVLKQDYNLQDGDDDDDLEEKFQKRVELARIQGKLTATTGCNLIGEIELNVSITKTLTDGEKEEDDFGDVDDMGWDDEESEESNKDCEDLDVYPDPENRLHCSSASSPVFRNFRNKLITFNQSGIFNLFSPDPNGVGGNTYVHAWVSKCGNGAYCISSVAIKWGGAWFLVDVRELKGSKRIRVQKSNNAVYYNVIVTASNRQAFFEFPDGLNIKVHYGRTPSCGNHLDVLIDGTAALAKNMVGMCARNADYVTEKTDSISRKKNLFMNMFHDEFKTLGPQTRHVQPLRKGWATCSYSGDAHVKPFHSRSKNVIARKEGFVTLLKSSMMEVIVQRERCTRFFCTTKVMVGVSADPSCGWKHINVTTSPSNFVLEHNLNKWEEASLIKLGPRSMRIKVPGNNTVELRIDHRGPLFGQTHLDVHIDAHRWFFGHQNESLLAYGACGGHQNYWCKTCMEPEWNKFQPNETVAGMLAKPACNVSLVTGPSDDDSAVNGDTSAPCTTTEEPIYVTVTQNEQPVTSNVYVTVNETDMEVVYVTVTQNSLVTNTNYQTVTETPTVASTSSTRRYVTVVVTEKPPTIMQTLTSTNVYVSSQTSTATAQVYSTVTLSGTRTVVLGTNAGSVAPTSVGGYGYPTSTTTAVPRSCDSYVEQAVPTSIDFGLAGDFNAVLFESYAGSSDVQGRLAVNGDASMDKGFSVGDQLTDIEPGLDVTLIVSGELYNWTVGRNFYGNVVVGSQLRSPVSPFILDYGCCVHTSQHFFDFETSYAELTKLSTKLSKMADTTVKKRLESRVQLEFGKKPTPSIEVVNVPNGKTFFTTVSEILPVLNLAPESIIVFNIGGEEAGLVAHNQEELMYYHVIFNFYEASRVTIRDIGVRGYVLAPKADISDATGVVWGSVYARSLTGPIQLNWVPFKQEPCRRIHKYRRKCTGVKLPSIEAANKALNGTVPPGSGMYVFYEEQLVEWKLVQSGVDAPTIPSLSLFVLACTVLLVVLFF